MMKKTFASFILAAAATFVLLRPTVAEPAPSRPAWGLMWFAIVPTPDGPFGFKTPEATAFASEAACVAFGERMTPRMQDWVRGLARADWDRDVRVAFRCAVAGVPS